VYKLARVVTIREEPGPPLSGDHLRRKYMIGQKGREKL
jgi:hypothetical protein